MRQFFALPRRNRELGLLLIVTATGVLALALVHLSQSPDLTVANLSLVLTVLAMFAGLHLIVRTVAPDADPVLLPLAAFLTVTGITMIYRLDPDLVLTQWIWVLVGGACLGAVLVAFRSYGQLAQYKYLSALAGMALLLSPLLPGIGAEINGARLWLRFGTFSFQPAEIAKVLIVIFLAAYLAEKRELLATSTRRVLGVWLPEARHFGPLLLMWGVSLLILVGEKDLGSSLLFFGVFLMMLYVATDRTAYVMAGSALFLGGASLAYLRFSHVQTRIDIWLDPWKDSADKGYQIVQSLFAIASGGVIGRGLGLGSPGKIPAVETDFIFSAIAEEMGLVGALAIVLAYLLLTLRGLRIASACNDEFGKLLALGLTAVVGLQTFVIIGGVTKLIPLTGITLPFISYGGSSIISNFILLGLLLRVSHLTRRQS
ncbi:MAG: FtsW/RodA/SpoVE family cell cycle protein [Actinobacteria bacterium]|nr:MAG: FtsW/RodA/SpoVE family cell cycle protein [Actinomycetota bacterium]